MTKLTTSLLLSVSMMTLAGVAHLPRAQACSEPQRGMIKSRQVLPAHASTSVPTNTRIYVGYESYTSEVSDHPRLQTADGKDVAVNLSQPLKSPSGLAYNHAFMLVPTAPLAPNTRYQILSDFGSIPCFQDPSMADGTYPPLCTQVDGGAASVAIASFMTGEGPDEVAPVLTGSLTYAPYWRMSCSAGACCGPHEGWDATLDWAKPTGDAGPVFYELLLERNALLLPIQDNVVDPSGTGTASLRGIFLCSGQIITDPLMFENARFVGTSGLYTLYALDLAGNRSQPLQAQVTVDCSGGDGGIDGSSGIDAPRDTTNPDIPGTGGATTTPGTGGAITTPGTGGAITISGTGGAITISGTGGAITIPGTGGTTTTPGTGGATVAPGTGGALGAGGISGAPSPGKADASPAGTTSSDSGCSCRMGGSQNAGAGLALLAASMLLARRPRRRR